MTVHLRWVLSLTGRRSRSEPRPIQSRPGSKTDKLLITNAFLAVRLCCIFPLLKINLLSTIVWSVGRTEKSVQRVKIISDTVLKCVPNIKLGQLSSFYPFNVLKSVRLWSWTLLPRTWNNISLTWHRRFVWCGFTWNTCFLSWKCHA